MKDKIDIVPSYETCLRMKEAGWEKETFYYWHDRYGGLFHKLLDAGILRTYVNVHTGDRWDDREGFISAPPSPR